MQLFSCFFVKIVTIKLTIDMIETQNKAEIFDEIVNARRSVRIYDTNVKVPDEVVKRSLSRALLAPNSSNLQLWELYWVKSPDKKEALAKICLGQKAATTASELIVVVTRKDKWKERSEFVFGESEKSFTNVPEKQQKLVKVYYKQLIPLLYSKTPLDVSGSVKKVMTTVKGLSGPTMREVTEEDMRVVVHKSAALAAQTFMLSIKAEGYDTCPMEGFDSLKAKKLLKLPAGAEINMIISVGLGKPEGIYGKRLRVPEKEVIFEV
jgi:nitroreductase